MRISMKSGEQKLPIHIIIPTSVVGWRWVWRLVNHASSNYISLPTGDGARELAAFLKQYVRENGHFDLVNIQSANGDRILIRILPEPAPEGFAFDGVFSAGFASQKKRKSKKHGNIPCFCSL